MSLENMPKTKEYLNKIKETGNILESLGLKDKKTLTIEQLEGYIECLKDMKENLIFDIKRYEEALKWRKKFNN